MITAPLVLFLVSVSVAQSESEKIFSTLSSTASLLKTMPMRRVAERYRSSFLSLRMSPFVGSFSLVHNMRTVDCTSLRSLLKYSNVSTADLKDPANTSSTISLSPGSSLFETFGELLPLQPTMSIFSKALSMYLADGQLHKPSSEWNLRHFKYS